jgi:integrase
MGKVKFHLKNPKSESETLIFLVYRFDNIYFKYYTGEYILPEYWDKEKQRPILSKKYPEGSDVDRQLTKYDFFLKDLVNESKRQNINITTEYLKVKLDEAFKIVDKGKAKGEKITLIKYINQYIQECESGKRLTPNGSRYKLLTIKGYKTLLFHLDGYMSFSHRKLDFDDITLDFYDDFMLYFHKNKAATNTIGKHVKNIKVIMRVALEEKLHSNSEFQRKKFKIVTEETDAIYLTEAEIQKIYKLNLSDNPKLEKVRDMFIVASRTALRFSDLVCLKENNFIHNNKGYFLRIHTQKTGEEVIVPLKREVVEIIHKYKFSLPRMISNQKMNDYLKELGQKAELNSIETKVTTKGGMRVDENFKKWELLTTHTARRSAATNLYLAGFPTISIMKLTGHRTEKSFMKYIRMSSEDNAYKMAESDYFKNDFKSDSKLKIVR